MLHQCHMIVAEMVHFVQQVQYYINFEVRGNERVTRIGDVCH